MFERRLYYHIDWALLIAMFALCALGVAMIFSTTSDPTRGNSHLYVTQLYAIGLGTIAMVFTLTLDYRTLTDKSHLIYIALLAVLLYVLFLGTVQMGARRWIPLGGFNLQPSEFAKVGVALVLAKYFGENRGMSLSTFGRCLTRSYMPGAKYTSLPFKRARYVSRPSASSAFASATFSMLLALIRPASRPAFLSCSGMSVTPWSALRPSTYCPGPTSRSSAFRKPPID